MYIKDDDIKLIKTHDGVEWGRGLNRARKPGWMRVIF